MKTNRVESNGGAMDPCGLLSRAWRGPAVILLAAMFATLPTALRAQDNLAATTLTKVGDVAPGFTTKSIDGREVSLASFRGKVVILSFFATWCPPCREELPRVQRELWQAMKGQGLVVLAVDRQESATKVASFVKAKGFTFPVMLDTDRKIFARYATDYIPRAYLIGPDGRIVYQTIGYDPADFDTLVWQAKTLIGDAPQAN
ncbi:thiol-disulfide oxidoreductase ResA [mine drainage metagenome]|uniref:Thiol-disulfide oxidoreductase ResA n=1 Tax=mine drainage metagenome TaxID=410659 RepID=A0A1J5SIH3_9ZZZZ